LTSSSFDVSGNRIFAGVTEGRPRASVSERWTGERLGRADNARERGFVGA
jgi:hypothetical protein